MALAPFGLQAPHAHPPLLLAWAREAGLELRENILPFWMNHTLDRERGGFFGEISNEGEVMREAVRGSVIAARQLWTFSAAHRAYRNINYLEVARFALDNLVRNFRDPAHDGLFWSVTADGRPEDARKQIYSQVFGIYALSEHARATESREALDRAIALHRFVELHARDRQHGGYFEACHRNWQLHGPAEKSIMGAVGPKSQNTHLHVMEAYTNLLRVWPDPRLRARQRELIGLMLERILNPATGSLHIFQEADWTPVSTAISYGHDIEAAWLLTEAAEVLGDEVLLARVRPLAVQLADRTLRVATDEDGAIFNQGEPSGPTQFEKDWWPQAEATIGFLNAYQISGDTRFLEASRKSWEFIQNHLVDRDRGEWFNSLTRDRKVRPLPKVGFWKGPYHNSRACLELASRLKVLAQSAMPGSGGRAPGSSSTPG